MANVIKLFMVGSGWGVPFATAAPFPLKLQAWLRMTGIQHEVAIENDPRKGPKKKTPWVEIDGVPMADSELVIQHLKQLCGVDPDARLTAVERGVGLAWQRTLEEHYHQAFEHQLFFGRGGKERLAEMLRVMPAILRPIISRVFRGDLGKQLYARGLGRHTEDQIIAMGKADLDALDAWLEGKIYMLGAEPSTVDATVFGFVGASIYVSGDNPLFRHAASLPNLARHADRMRARLFPETLDKKEEAA